jgi:hypothetical protein
MLFSGTEGKVIALQIASGENLKGTWVKFRRY